MRATHAAIHEDAIFIGMPIDESLAVDFEDALMILVQRRAPIVTVYINSPGGLAEASLRIMNLMEGSNRRIRTVCLGRASGCAAHLFCSGDERFAVSDAAISFEDLRGDDRHDSKVIEALRILFAERTARKLGIDQSEVRRWLEIERSFSGRELLISGLVQKTI